MIYKSKYTDLGQVAQKQALKWMYIDMTVEERSQKRKRWAVNSQHGLLHSSHFQKGLVSG